MILWQVQAVAHVAVASVEVHVAAVAAHVAVFQVVQEVQVVAASAEVHAEAALVEDITAVDSTVDIIPHHQDIITDQFSTDEVITEVAVIIITTAVAEFFLHS